MPSSSAPESAGSPWPRPSYAAPRAPPRAISLTSAPAVALRDTVVAAATRLAPGLLLRGFDGIADWRPRPRRPRSRPE
ncbi:hypothetical protein [Streptomyces botrytidirepellens]|uniref:hypothetical protein n=1 Tax=Streptomyces botrytidirepellens TaxID=2486417 RepID=UPI00160B6786